MKNIFAVVCVFIFFVSISHPAFSFDLNGWWSRENKIPNTPELLKITSERFSGIKYSIISSSLDEIKISIDNGRPTTIKSLGNDKISITTVNNNTLIYKRVHTNVNMSEKEAERLSKQP